MDAPTPDQKLIVGAKLYYVPHDSRRHSPRHVTVTRVGRKWADIDSGQRIDVKTLAVDAGGYSSPGRCWRSEEEYTRHAQLQEAWRAFRALVDKEWEAPAGVTMNQIENAKRSLFKGSK